MAFFKKLVRRMHILDRMQQVFQDAMDFRLMTTRFEGQALGNVATAGAGIVTPTHSADPFARHLNEAMASRRPESSKLESKESRHSHSRKDVRPSHKPGSATPGGTLEMPAAPVVANPQPSPDPQALSLDPLSGSSPPASQAQSPNPSAGQPARSQQSQDSQASTGQQPQPHPAKDAPTSRQPQPTQPAANKDASAPNPAQPPGADAAKADAQAQAARLLAAAETVAIKLASLVPEAARRADAPASSRDGGEADSRLRGNDEVGANLQRQAAGNRLAEASRQAANASADSNPSRKQDPAAPLTIAQMIADEDAVAVNPPPASGAPSVGEVVLGKTQPSSGGTAGPAILPSPSAPAQALMPAAQSTNASGGQTPADSDASSRDSDVRVAGHESAGVRAQAPVNPESFSLHDLASSAAVSQSTPARDSASSRTASPLPSGSSAAQEQALAAWQAVNAQIGHIVNAAALYQAASGVEMRLQLRTETLGPVEIRAALDGDKLGAAIGVQNPEAHATLTNQLPALQQSLVHHNVQVEHLSVFNGAAGGSMNSGSGSGHHAEQFAPPPSRPFPSDAHGISAASPRAEVLSLENAARRLSVRA